MINIAIMGFGVVGSGVAGVIERNAEALRGKLGCDVYVKYILDRFDFPDSPYKDRVVHDIDVIAEDAEVSIVCETMGGTKAAYEFSVKLMEAGKSIVTSNKAVVAKYGCELLQKAAECGVSYLFEASVGGGIPVIRSMRTAFSGDSIVKIEGILNGTTNYILTKMKRDKADFTSALEEAQRLGYAEADPSADVDGFDAQRKIIILTAVATGMLVPEENVYAQTITNVTAEDMSAAQRWGGDIKLIGRYIKDGDKHALYVAPFFVKSDNILSNIDDVYNGISVTSNITGDYMFYGRGAGRYPTAGAIVADIVSAASGAAAGETPVRWRRALPEETSKYEEQPFKWYIRVNTSDAPGCRENISVLFGDVDYLNESPGAKVEFITGNMSTKEIDLLLSRSEMSEAESAIKILD